MEETEIGDYEHKLIKTAWLPRKHPVQRICLTEAITGDNGLTLVEYCPFGVIGCYYAYHQSHRDNHQQFHFNDCRRQYGCFQPSSQSQKVSQMTVKMLNKALIDNGAPPNPDYHGGRTVH